MPTPAGVRTNRFHGLVWARCAATEEAALWERRLAGGAALSRQCGRGRQAFPAGSAARDGRHGLRARLLLLRLRLWLCLLPLGHVQLSNLEAGHVRLSNLKVGHVRLSNLEAGQGGR